MTRGPVPKRSDQRRRTNESWIDKINATPARRPSPDSEQPPRSGPGATTAAWRSYAEQLGIDVPARAGRAAIIALVDGIAAPGESPRWHPLARSWYRSLAESAQSKFYEPSDWQTARVLAEVLSRALAAGKVTAALIERWQVGATELLTTEGARRRMRIELERAPQPNGAEGDADVTWLDDARNRIFGQPG